MNRCQLVKLGREEQHQAAPDHLRTTGEDRASACELREARYRVALAMVVGDTPDPACTGRINKMAARPDLMPQLTSASALASASHGQPTLHWQAARPARAALATVACDAVLVLAGHRQLGAGCARVQGPLPCNWVGVAAGALTCVKKHIPIVAPIGR